VSVWLGLGVCEEAEKRLCVLLKGCRVRCKRARRFVSKVRRGFSYWFSFVVVEGWMLLIMWLSVRCVRVWCSVKFLVLCAMKKVPYLRNFIHANNNLETAKF